jgi:hypothetical protein
VSIPLEQAYAAYRSATTDLCGILWRQGSSEPCNVYACNVSGTGGDPKKDHEIGAFRTPELAAAAVGDHNAALHALLEN